MTRSILDETRLHPAIRQQVAAYQDGIVKEVQSAVAANPVLVVGMAHNPFCKKARQALDASGIAFRYLEYGNYFSKWQARGALKMWTGWPTFPMVFINGTLVGGFTDLKRLLESGELKA